MYCNNPNLYRRNRQPSWNSVFNGLDKQIESIFAGFPAIFDAVAQAAAPGGARWFENDTAYFAQVDLPGVDPKDIDLTFEDGHVEISAKRSGDANEENGQTRNYRFALEAPEGVDVERIAARAENGVLTVEFPKSAKTQPRRIEVAQG